MKTSYTSSLARTYNRLKTPSIWGSVTKAVVFNPADLKFIITSLDGVAYETAVSRGRVVGAFDNNVEFNHLWDECKFVFKTFYPDKRFKYVRAI